MLLEADGMIDSGGPGFRGPPLFPLRANRERQMRAITALLALLLGTSWPVNVADAKAVQEFNLAVPPVYPGDVKRPYRIIGEIKDNLRKHFAFQESPTKEKIYAEIWERGRKLGADAVINARYGTTERTIFNHGRTPISGTAIKFTDAGDNGRQ